MQLRKAAESEFTAIRDFYWESIDLMQGRSDSVGWKKGIYPEDRFLLESLEKGQLYVIGDGGAYKAAVIINSEWNEGYAGIVWGIECAKEDVLVPHALAVYPKLQGQGLGKLVVRDILELARDQGKKTVRLDLLEGNIAAERLYEGEDFSFVQAKKLYYADTGLTVFKMYEYLL